MKPMKVTLLFMFACLFLAMFTSLEFRTAVADEKEKKELTLKGIMKTAFKGDLVKAVGTGKATDEQKEKMLTFAKAMTKLKPPRGEEESWKEKTKALVEATQACVDAKDDAASLFKTAANCAACHRSHKPK